MNAPQTIQVRVRNGVRYPRAPIAQTRAELGRKPTIHELVMAGISTTAVRLARAGLPIDPAAPATIAAMLEHVELAGDVLDAPPRGTRGGKRGRRERSATHEPDLNSLHWYAHTRLEDGGPIVALWWAYEREFLGPNGEQLDHRSDARTLLLQAGYGIPDDLSSLGGVNDTMTHRTDAEDERA